MLAHHDMDLLINMPIGKRSIMLQIGKNDFGIHAVYKTSQYYMLKIKSGRKKAKLPSGTSLKVQEFGYGIQR